MRCLCDTNNRAPWWTFTDPCKPEVRPAAREESVSPAWLAAPVMNARDTTKGIYGGLTLDVDRHCIYMWSWSEMLTVSYRSRARTVWIPLRRSTEICWLGEGHSLWPCECRISVGKPFLRRKRKCCQLETRASWWYLLQCTCSSNQSVPLQNRVPRDLKLNTSICISDFHFCE